MRREPRIYRVPTPFVGVLTLSRYIVPMSLTRRATIYLDPDLHQALRMKAVEPQVVEVSPSSASCSTR